LKGFAASDCAAIRTDSVHSAVTWRNQKNLKSLAGKTVRLRFHLRQGDLYTFSLEQ
jgi:hypothetical protein